MTIINPVYNALVVVWQRCAPLDLGGGLTFEQSDVFDGPTADFVGPFGVCVGSTVTDTTGQITYGTTDLKMDQGETTVAPLLIWAGSGAGPYRPLRDRVDMLASAFRVELARDRVLGGLVSTTRIVNGAYDQQWITGRGPLVLFEQRLQYRCL